MRLVLVTPSFSADHPLCAELCRSIDRFNRDGLEHVLVVPREDMALFAPLAGPGRRVVAQEEVLDTRLFRVPAPAEIRIPGLFAKRLRKLWLTPGLRPVRGWMIQQVVKLSADRLADADAYVFIDSDAVMIRPFGTGSFVNEGRLPLFRVPGALAPDAQPFADWQAVARALLGLPPASYEGETWISTVMCFRRDRLREIQARIAEVAGRDFQSALLARRTLSEYFIYGTHCLEIAAGDGGHVVTDRSLCREEWAYDGAEDMARRYAEGIGPEHVAVLIQSTSGWPMERRREVVDAITAVAQD